jgi:DNA-binding SARP family transcriptional activator/LysM repeat protein
MIRRTTGLLSALTAACGLLALVAGTPVLLIAIAGWPLPTTMPDLESLRTALEQQHIPAELVVNTLAAVVWIIWAQLLWALVWETTVNGPRLVRGQRVRPAPLVVGPLNALAARLLTTILALGIVSAPANAVAHPLTVLEVGAAVDPLTEAPPGDPLPAPVNSSSSPRDRAWTVQTGDSLWAIAEETLGDGARFPEILALNPAVSSPRAVRPGMVLVLPATARVPAERHIDLSTASSGGNEPAPHLPSRDITITEGDTLWDLARDRLTEAMTTAPHPAATVNYLDNVIAANAAIVEDPDLIYPGEVFHFPPIGDPPPTLLVDPTPATEPPPPPSSTDPTAVADATAGPVTPCHPAPAQPPNPATPGTPHHERAPGSMLLGGLAGSTLLATGVLATYRRLRRRQQAISASRAKPIAEATARHEVEQALIVGADLPLLRWAAHQLALLARTLKPDTTPAAPLAVELSPEHGIEILWETPMPIPARSWAAVEAGWAWKRPYDDDERLPATPVPAVCPGLVTIGRRTEGHQLLIDLEAYGSLAVSGDPAAAEDAFRSLILELGTAEELADAYVSIVGFDDPALNHLPRVRARTETDAVAHLSQIAADFERAAREADVAGSFLLRTGDYTGGRELTVVAVRADACTDLPTLLATSPARRGVAVIVLGHADKAGSHLIVEADRTATFQPLGIQLAAVGVPAVVTAEIANLLYQGATTEVEESPDPETAANGEASDRAAPSPITETKPPVARGDDSGGSETGSPIPDPDSQHLSGNGLQESSPEGAPARSLDDELRDVLDEDAAVDLQAAGDLLAADGQDDWSRPTPEVVVQVLGVPHCPRFPDLSPMDLNLLTFLATNGGEATISQVIDAVWAGRAVEDKTVWNRVAHARAVVGHYLPGREPGDRLRLTDGVMTDLEIFATLADRAEQVSSTEALELLTEAMDLIRGVPFDGATFEWAHHHQFAAQAAELIEQAALRTVELAIEANEPARARRAINQGLRALGINEPLYRARMRLESIQHNPAGVKGAFAELERLLADLYDDPTITPSPRTRALLEELLRGGKTTPIDDERTM